MRMARCGRNVFGGSGCSPLYSFRVGLSSRSGTIDYAISMRFAVKGEQFMERAPERADSAGPTDRGLGANLRALVRFSIQTDT